MEAVCRMARQVDLERAEESGLTQAAKVFVGGDTKAEKNNPSHFKKKFVLIFCKGDRVKMIDGNGHFPIFDGHTKRPLD